MQHIIFLSLLLGNAVYAASPTTEPISDQPQFSCSNRDMEITCNTEECIISDTFTPLDVSLYFNGNMHVCAYSGCYSGKAVIFNHPPYIIYAGSNLLLNVDRDASSETMAITISINTMTNIAVINGGPFAMPLLCE